MYIDETYLLVKALICAGNVLLLYLIYYMYVSIAEEYAVNILLWLLSVCGKVHAGGSVWLLGAEAGWQ